MIFFSKTPCGCFLIALWYPKTTAKNAGRYAKKNPITILQIQFKDRCSQTYTEFLMAYGSEKTRYENMKTRRVRIESKTNMATPGESLFSAPVLLTENDIPGASLQGRKPEEMKKADLLFWLRCRGDSCKGMTVKAQLVKRYVSVKFLMLLY